MSQRIRRVELTDRTLVPAEAEVWVTVHLDEITPTTEVRGRFMGPTCRYASTVEVAYPLRPLAKSQTPKDSEELTMRVVIPEPSFWDPISPFLYQGPVELWQHGQCVERIMIRHALCSLTLSAHGLRWNGRPLTLHGREVPFVTEEEMLALRAAGYNMLTVPVSAGTAPMWEQADRIGFLLLGRVQSLSDSIVVNFASHPSCLGFLFDAHTWLDAERAEREHFMIRTCALIGLEFHVVPSGPLPKGVRFVVCDTAHREEMAGVGVPLVLRGKSGADHTSVLGYIE
jgi:hypothetical protein